MAPTSEPAYRTELQRIIKTEFRVQAELARRCNLDTGLLSRYANGLHCPQHHREAIAAALQRDVSEVFPSEIAA